jgi:CRISPR-associated protein Cas1
MTTYFPQHNKQQLPRVSDSWSCVYIETAHIERDAHALVVSNEQGQTRLPSAQFVSILAGPGTTITHAASSLLAERGCSMVWCGEAAVRFYASALPETHTSALLESQAQAWAFPQARAEVARRMYRMRFPDDPVDERTNIEQLRGREGAQMRTLYREIAQRYGVEWQGRSYDEADGLSNDPIQQAINVANSCLYGVCHAAIVSIGMTGGLGFVHHGHQRSFVFDMADLYKATVSLPIAFAAVAESETNSAQRVRRACRDAFYTQRLLARIVPDLLGLFAVPIPGVRYIDMQKDDLGDQTLGGE